MDSQNLQRRVFRKALDSDMKRQWSALGTQGGALPQGTACTSKRERERESLPPGVLNTLCASVRFSTYKLIRMQCEGLLSLQPAHRRIERVRIPYKTCIKHD